MRKFTRLSVSFNGGTWPAGAFQVNSHHHSAFNANPHAFLLAVRLLTFVCLFFFCNQISGSSDGQPVQAFESGSDKVGLLELFTSQGCSSCPPAEEWLNRLEKDSRLWREVVPVAFHVDYWDRLGWPDPFASEENTMRQRRYKLEGGIASVYTPGFVLNGHEWRGWFERQKLPKQTGKAGNLFVTIDGQKAQATYANFRDTYRLHLAVLGIGLKTSVKRGENRNRDLAQSFVVLSHESFAPKSDRWKVSFNIPDNHSAKRLALAAWISDGESQGPLQATGGWLELGSK